jgi:membrane-associated PAP2 superfamily phosphatase
LVALLFSRHIAIISEHSHQLSLELISILTITAVCAFLKASTNVACPTALTQFGGYLDHIGLFQHYPEANLPRSRQRCFPAGHASMGFSLMSLFILFPVKRHQVIAVSAALAIGWITGLYKMVIGDHFVSHTIATMTIAWLLLNLILLTEQQLYSAPRAKDYKQ